MPAEQTHAKPTLWPDVPAGTCIRAMAVDIDGFHHRAPHIGRIRPAVGGHRPIHQDGTLHLALRKNRGRPSGYLRLGGTEVPRPLR